MIKNMNFEEIFDMRNLIEVNHGQVVSKTFAQNEAVSLTLFAFSKDEEISTHESDGDALVTILEGRARITIDGKIFILEEKESIVMPAKKPHAVYAIENFKMLLTVLF